MIEVGPTKIEKRRRREESDIVCNGERDYHGQARREEMRAI
jgi:hypothetical protein